MHSCPPHQASMMLCKWTKDQASILWNYKLKQALPSVCCFFWSFGHRDLLSASHLPNPGTTLWTSVAVILSHIQGICRKRKKIHVIFTLSNMTFILKATEFVICQKESRIELRIVLSKNEELLYSRIA